MQVFSRYVLESSLFWSEEFMRYLMLWIVAVGAGISYTRGQFLGIWRFMADAGATGGPVLLSGITALVSLGAGVAATGVLGFAAAAVFAVTIPRLRHRRNY